jgi:hypothetical protein
MLLKIYKVVIRTDDMTIFSGTFFTSNFKTMLDDVSKIPYHVDITVEHKDYDIQSYTFDSDNVDSIAWCISGLILIHMYLYKID